MANIRTKSLTEEQYEMIIETMRKGFLDCRPNNKIATVLVLEANLGLRISDIVGCVKYDSDGKRVIKDGLKQSDIIQDGDRYRLDIVEQKTHKKREFTIPVPLYNYIKQYCVDNEIKSNEVIFPLSERAVQKHLKRVCDYLGIEGISTHSFRKFYATRIYVKNNYNIVLVQRLLQHSTPATTQRYIGIGPEELEKAIVNNLDLR